MVDKKTFNDILSQYKKEFSGRHWENEKYKWEAVKRFQEIWDIHAPNFSDMFMKATDRSDNLLASMSNYPRSMIKEFATVDPEFVRGMFIYLFDESKSLSDRYEKFASDAEKIRVKYDNGTWRNHYQNANAISTYLWLRYPDRYYIYKYSECRAVAKKLNADFSPRKGMSIENVMGGLKLYDEICDLLKEDSEMRDLVRSCLLDSCYPDTELKTLTVDFGFYISRYLVTSETIVQDDETPTYWPPLEKYNPNLTKDDWKKFLLDVLIPEHGASLQMLKALIELGGEATCKKLSEVFGGNPTRYVGCTTVIGKRAKKYFSLPPCLDGEFERVFVIPFLGRYVEGGKYYSYRIRPELFEALKEVDLSDIDPYYVEDSNIDSVDNNDVSENENTEDVAHDEVNPVETSLGCEKYTKENFLAEVYMSEERYDTLVHLLLNKMNVILQGAPGVGKTFTAKRLAYSIMGEKDESRIEFIQFHQNYSYEDFIMGYKPEGESFELKYGIFYRFCKKAESHPEKKYFFIIDEINRGNMSKIFGELMLLIEKDYRETKTTLAYNGLPFSVPQNLYIIGMMNTSDRSLAMIDYALRRRFSFFEIEPGFRSEGFKAYQAAIQNDTFNELIEKIVELNKEIESDASLGRGFCIGHSYFCAKSVCSEWMREVVEYDILPMLREYWFDNPDEVRRWEKTLRSVFYD